MRTLLAEVGTYDGPEPSIENASAACASITTPKVDVPRSIHVLVAVTDASDPPLTRYRRVILTVEP